MKKHLARISHTHTKHRSPGDVKFMYAINLTRFPTEDRLPTHCKPVSLAFQGCQGRRVTAAFDGGSITSNAGALLLRKADRSTGLFNRVAAGFTDHRDPRLTEHSVRTLVAQRITGITLGYEDLNDHDDLRHDPCWRCFPASSRHAGRTARHWRARVR